MIKISKGMISPTDAVNNNNTNSGNALIAGSSM